MAKSKTPAKSAKKAAPKAAKPLKKMAAKAVNPAKPVKAAKAAAKTTKAPVAAKPAKVAKPAPTKQAKGTRPEPVKAKAITPEKVKAGKATKAEKPVEAVVPAEAKTGDEEVVLTNAEGQRYCKASDCDELATTDSYCRYHYLLLWKRIQVRKKILVDDKLNRYIEELTSRYPDRFLEILRKDLANEKDFLAVLQELEIDESSDDDSSEDDARTYIDEVRGVTTSGGGVTEEEPEF